VAHSIQFAAGAPCRNRGNCQLPDLAADGVINRSPRWSTQ
jgi:hypothetical protein